MADITNLREAFLDELRDIYHAEKQLLKALPKLAKAASDPELRGALDSHLAETEQQIRRLDEVFGLVGEPPATKTCAGMAGIIEEGSASLDAESGRVRWTRDLGAERVNYSILADGLLWVQATDRATHRDRLWRIDPHSGRVTGAVTLPAFGAASMAAVGGRIWIVTTGGDLVVAG